jgi:predicted methyltransferase
MQKCVPLYWKENIMNKYISLAFALIASSSMTACAMMEPDNSAVIQSAVEDSARPETDVVRDGDRKPAEVLAFSGIGPGDVVGDIGSAGGYYTRLLSGVVGPEGHVYGFNGKEFSFVFKDGNPTDPIAAELDNVTSVMGTLSGPTFDKPLDAAIIVNIYHDSHLTRLGVDTDSMNQAIFAALKPGGTYLVADHKSADGAGAGDADKLHRIDPALVRSEVEAAGFEFVGESDALSHPEDDRTIMAMLPNIRGNTDRFVFKFRKPK